MPEGALDRIYQELLDMFAVVKVSVDPPRADGPPRWQEGPGFYTMRFKPPVGVNPSIVTGKVQEMKILLELEEQQEIRHAVDRGSVVFEIPKLDGQRYDVVRSEVWDFFDWA